MAPCVLSDARLSALHSTVFGFRTLAKRAALRPACSRGDPPRAPLVVTAVSEAPRVVVTSQPRRTPVPLRPRLVSGDALGERDYRKIITRQHVSKIFGAIPGKPMDILVMARRNRRWVNTLVST